MQFPVEVFNTDYLVHHFINKNRLVSLQLISTKNFSEMLKKIQKIELRVIGIETVPVR